MRKREAYTWAIREIESVAAIHVRGVGQDEQLPTFPFLLSFGLVFSDLQAPWKELFCFRCCSQGFAEQALHFSHL
jgi:hypothetical protein